MRGLWYSPLVDDVSRSVPGGEAGLRREEIFIFTREFETVCVSGWQILFQSEGGGKDGEKGEDGKGGTELSIESWLWEAVNESR